MSREKYLRLGELLIKEGLLNASQLEKSVVTQKKEGGRLGEVVVKLGFIREDQLVQILGKQLGIPYFSLGTGMLKPAGDQGLEKLFTQDFCLKNSVIPLSRTLRSLTVAMSDPHDIILIDNMKKITGCDINVVIATRSDILKSVEQFFGKAAMLQEAVDASYDVMSASKPADDLDYSDTELSLDKLMARAEEAPVVKLVDLIIRQAIDEHASDIHIEPFKDRINVLLS